MFRLLAAELADAHEPDDQPSAMGRVKVWVRKGAEKTRPVLKKAASLTLSGLKKAGAAGVDFTKTATSRVRDEIAKRRGEEPSADSNAAKASMEEAAAEEAAAEESAAGEGYGEVTHFTRQLPARGCWAGATGSAS